MPHPKLDSEDALERETMQLFRALGWKTGFAMHEWDTGTSALGRETMADVVLLPHLRAALHRLNAELANNAIDLAVEQLTRDRSTLSPAAANREVYRLLRDGVLVTITSDDGEERVERIQVIDWQTSARNDYLLISQLWVSGEYGKKRADLVGFVNGLPLLFIELKAHHKSVRAAYSNNLSDYKTTIPQLFWHNALIILSNGSESRAGSLTAEWDHFSEWKRINAEGEQGVISLETTVRALCEPARLLDLAENFTLFEEASGGLIKLVAKNHQYLGVNNAVQAVRELGSNQGRLGVFWHTQGSGKSYSMVFFSQKILRTITGNWTFLILTDRLDLDEQIYKNFARVGAVSEPEEHVRAQDGVHLQRLLREDHRYLFTLIQKFRTEGGAPYPKLSERGDIIVITDEAHRSQYDIFAQNMRSALPNAAFIGFTGTPLIVGEEKTREVFGDYISIYNFQQSIVDRATVPLYYENRIPEVQIINAQLNDDMAEILDAAMLDEAQERKLEQEFRHEYQVITRDERLETIAEDIVAHFVGRGYRGKAMVVALDKMTAVRMYDKVQAHWKQYLAELHARLNKSLTETERADLEEAIGFMQTTDMAVVVSSAQNEVELFKKKGLDIAPHRKRMVSEDLDTKFKDPNDPFRMVFVCAMWMTGFDVPSCSTIYLDKPMRNHTLMQTIARANRVYRDKVSGVIVDYIGVFRSLKQALAIYGSGTQDQDSGGDTPVRDKQALVAELKQALADAREFCIARGIDLSAIVAAESAFKRIALVKDAAEAIIGSDEQKQQYLDHANTVDRLFRAILPDDAANLLSAERAAVIVIADRIRALAAPTDIEAVMDQVSELLDESVAPLTEYVIRGRDYRRIGETRADDDEYRVNLSDIDFDALRAAFETGRKRTEAEKLRGAISGKLGRMVRLNKTRMNYLEQFQRMIDEYNNGAKNVEAFFAQLVSFAASLNTEEQRAIAEHLEEEELTLFDILTKPDVTPTTTEAEQIKTVARELLATLKREKLVLDWRKKQQARAAVRVTIEEVLDQLPERYTKELYDQKCQAVYLHVYESYFGQNRSIYSRAA